tara:strand:- start:747 stop:989 length:243 start_codon:yes stop_codon:yes gene_type:complete
MKKLKEFLQDNIIIPPSILAFTKVIHNLISLTLFIIFNASVFLVGSLFVIKWMAETNLVLTLMLLVFIVYGFFMVLKSNK